jgi:hypothetical protein
MEAFRLVHREKCGHLLIGPRRYEDASLRRSDPITAYDC